jgi:hypothetical protein
MQAVLKGGDLWKLLELSSNFHHQWINVLMDSKIPIDNWEVVQL